MKRLKSKHTGVIFGYCEAMVATGDYDVIEDKPVPTTAPKRRGRSKKVSAATQAIAEQLDLELDDGVYD
jgi:hypothetical protein